MPTSLYDKYRARCPELLDRLEHARATGRFSHAFLLQADSAQTRREFAAVLAQIAACPNGQAGRPCTNCRVCRQLESGDYSELYTLSPIGKMYQIQVGDRTNPEPNTLRYFEEQFFLTSTGGADCKVGIIYDADRMGDEAQNALLKTLEEPPRDTLIILATGNPSALLPTTRSRCQPLLLLDNRCDFEFAGAQELFDTLFELFFNAQGDLAKTEACAGRLIRIAAGLSADAAIKTESEWSGRMEAALRGDPSFAKRVELQQTAAANGAYMKERGLFLSAIHTFCAQLFLLASGAELKDLANPEVFRQPLPTVDTIRASVALREAEDLLFTLRFNVSEELALRTFAVNLAMK